MAKKKSRKPCYYCGAQIGQDGSKEHVPPQMMFKDGTDSITVYSCKEHNEGKSDTDAAIVSLLIRASILQWCGLRNNPLEVLEAMNLAQQTIKEHKGKYPDKPLLKDLPEELEDLPDFPYFPPKLDIKSWIRQLTAGLVYNAVKGFDSSVKWADIDVMSPDMFDTDTESFNNEDLPLLLDRLSVKQAEAQRINLGHWCDGWPSGKKNPYPPKIYFFQVGFRPDNVYFKHRFYDTFDWYVRFKPLPNTVLKLTSKVGLSA